MELKWQARHSHLSAGGQKSRLEIKFFRHVWRILEVWAVYFSYAISRQDLLFIDRINNWKLFLITLHWKLLLKLGRVVVLDKINHHVCKIFSEVSTLFPVSVVLFLGFLLTSGFRAPGSTLYYKVICVILVFVWKNWKNIFLLKCNWHAVLR